MSDIFQFDEHFWQYFHELFEALPRQGPGLDESTRHALGLLPPLGPDQSILDIGCGSGVQTLELARRSPARITATDLHRPFLEILKRNAMAQGLDERISTVVADMADLPFPDRSFDVVWAEGCSFIVGFARALELWRRLLKPGGRMVVSEFTWFSDDIPAELREFCVPDPTEDASPAGRRASIAAAGYELLHEFRLPPEGWSKSYYGPLQVQLDGFAARHAGTPAAMNVVAHCRQELELSRKYGDRYGYTFFIMGLRD
ncbi:MAG TPA: class I SAM-dependent methyltransferase [Myxococcota bacterium]|nr:class I SAM-dependent methyltransferase [Myxococcota bacterium]HOA13061.1 class I SAM-dependent methyltransferase [Myxococcota bacterium]HOC98722.1 class I SAM-dependent methyltransferase [Myxococcota bacterium]HOH76081.1 class I SAM-dependent methyltransferase [Myxococcota bacterium]HPV04307.1 class I SAM-dependent methyltransferase [Myxococcota bacterium]